MAAVTADGAGSLLWAPFAEWRASLNPTPEELGFYEGFYASLYDRTTFGDQTGAARYLELAERYPGTLLEPFCGSGRILLRLAHHGHEVVGLDSSDEMVELLAQRIALLPEETRARVTVHRGDARDFDLGRAFPLIIVPANSLPLLHRAEDRAAFYRGARRHLEDDGMLAFDYVRVPDRAVRQIDGGLKALEETLGDRTVLSVFGIRFSAETACFNILSHELVGGSSRSHFGAFRFARMDDGEVERALSAAGLEIREREVQPDHLLGVEVSRCFLRCGVRRRRGYPLWHPHLPMNDAEQLVTVLAEGEGTRVRDREGREYIDAAGGLWSTQCGQGRREIVQAVTRQLERLSYGTLFALRSNEPAIELSRALVEMAPGAMSRAFLTGSGSESVELAVKLVRLFHSLGGEPERHGVAHLDESYHGTFYASMGVTGLHPNKEHLGPPLAGLVPIPAPVDSARRTAAEAEAASLAALEAAMTRGETPLAGVILELVLGSAGCAVPSGAWLGEVARLCALHDVFLIVDEVATGFGRTGRWFACEHFDLRPDVLLLAKGITSGYLPLGGVLFTERIAERLLERRSGIGHGSSANGTPACCAAALSTIDVIRRERLVERAAEAGGHLRRRLEALAGAPGIRSTRGLGLMRSVLLEPGDEPMPARVGRVLFGMQQDGVLAYPFAEGISFLPALDIPPAEIDAVADALERAAAG